MANQGMSGGCCPGMGEASPPSRSVAKWQPGDGPGPSPKAPRIKDEDYKFSERKAPGAAAKKKVPTSPAAASETNWLLWGGVAVVAAFFLLRKK